MVFKYYLLFVDTKFRMNCLGLYCQSVMQFYRLTTDLSAASLLSKTFTKNPYSV